MRTMLNEVEPKQIRMQYKTTVAELERRGEVGRDEILGPILSPVIGWDGVFQFREDIV